MRGGHWFVAFAGFCSVSISIMKGWSQTTSVRSAAYTSWKCGIWSWPLIQAHHWQAAFFSSSYFTFSSISPLFFILLHLLSCHKLWLGRILSWSSKKIFLTSLKSEILTWIKQLGNTHLGKKVWVSIEFYIPTMPYLPYCTPILILNSSKMSPPPGSCLWRSR